MKAGGGGNPGVPPPPALAGFLSTGMASPAGNTVFGRLDLLGPEWLHE